MTIRVRQPHPLRREVVSFGRRDGRASRRLLDPNEPGLTGYLVQPPRSVRATSVALDWRFEPEAIFGRSADLVVEIGTGTGEAILAAAQADPGADHLGIEVYRPGLARTIRAAQRVGVSNLRMLEADAREVLARALPESRLAQVRVFFPDPWPKLRHRKRRLVDVALMADVARLLRPGGLVVLATDWADYAEQIRRAAAAHPTLVELPPDAVPALARDRPTTKFELRAAREGRLVRELRYRRI